jgi:PAS domain S-box-containing protein
MAATLKKERVLLVDDEPQMLVALEDLLNDKFTILKTSSGDEALNVLAQDLDIAVVVTDQRMPRMTGDQLLAKLDMSCTAQRILVTGFADLTAVIRAVNEGKLFAYITKPWEASDLRSKVDRAAAQFRSTRELMNERQLLHDLMVNSPDGIYLKDRQLRFVQVNRSYAVSTGHVSVAELLGKRLPEVADPGMAAETEAVEQRVIQNGTAALDTLRAYAQNDSKRWFSESTAPIRGSQGDVIGLLGISRDVTDRVAAREALAGSEARFRAQTRLLHSILDNLAEGVLVADQSGKFLLFNRQATKLLGLASDELSVSNWTATCGVYLGDRKTPLPAGDDPLLRAMAGDASTEIEVFVCNAGVAGSIVQLTATPLAEEDGSVTGGIAVLRDVTTRKELERRLAQAHKMEAVGRLAGGIAHDFNNLLSVIQGCTELLLKDSVEGEQRNDLNDILAASERAAMLTNQLLLFSRQQVIQSETLQLNQVVAQLEAMLSRILGKRVNFTTSLDGTLGVIQADRSRIEQIIVNLTINARDAMPNGGALTIRTQHVQLDANQLSIASGVSPGEFAVLTVSDTGVGMDAHTQEHMFEPFYTTKEVGKGTGLGLATIYGIVRESGGFVRWQSQLGRGTSFDVYLPSSHSTPALPTEDSKIATLGTPSAGTVLLVEDEDAVRTLAARMLRMHGYHVLEARLPSEARRLCGENLGRIDLLLTDISMPEISGTRLAEELCALCPGLQVVYMSGYVGTSIPLGDEPRKGVWYLGKPFTSSMLLDKVTKALAPKR